MAITFKKCCFSINLRLGTIIIALVSAVVESISLIINVSEMLNTQYSVHESGYISPLRFILLVFLLFTCLKLALCASLYIGILERRPDHLEIWYKGYMVSVTLYTAFVIFKAMKEADIDSFLFWLILAGNLLLILTTFYFILVVRSYHHQMCRQPNYYQDFSHKQNSKTYCEKPKDANGEIVLFAATTPTKKTDGLYPTFFNEGGGTVYTTPQSSQMSHIPIMPSFLLDNGKRPNFDFHTTEKEQRRSSSSEPTKKKLCVSFANHIDLE